MDAVAFGSRERARPADRARARHAPAVRGELPEAAGRFPPDAYRADDPELLLWILAALAESAMLVYGKYVRALARDELDALWRDYRVVGRRFGLRARDMPPDIDAFDAYMGGMYAAASCGHAARPASWRSTSSCTRRCRCACARWSSWSTRSRSGCCRGICAASTGSAGTRSGPSRYTAAPRTRRVVLPAFRLAPVVHGWRRPGGART